MLKNGSRSAEGSQFSQLQLTSSNATLGRRNLIERFTFILPLVLAIVLLVQEVVVLVLLSVPLRHPSVVNSNFAALLVNGVAVLIFREFCRTPGTSRFAAILPSYMLPVLAVVVILIGLRIPYNNYMLLAGVLVGIATCYVVVLFQRPASGRKLYLVPGGGTEALGQDMAWLETVMLGDPAELARCGDGAVVADLRYELSSEWERAIARAAITGVPVYHVKQVRESLTGRVQIDALSENSFGSLVPSLSYLVVKRVIDLLGSLVLLVVLAIPLLILGLLVRATSPGPAIYRHRRMGYRGRVFETLKFRTMSMSAHDENDLESQKTQENDPRVTSIGRFLRMTRLDELPQLINVVRGEMSLIGPRPEALALSRWYDQHLDFYEYRHIVRPGITGWAQVNQGHVTELDDVYIKLQYDFYYIKNVSAWLDLLIALRTLAVMVNFRGAK